MAFLNVPSGISTAEPSIIFPPGTYGLMAPMLIPLDAGMAIAPVVAFAVTVEIRVKVQRSDNCQRPLLPLQSTVLLRLLLPVA